ICVSVTGTAGKMRTTPSFRLKKARHSFAVSPSRRMRTSKERVDDQNQIHRVTEYWRSSRIGYPVTGSSFRCHVRERENHYSRRCRQTVPIHEPSLLAVGRCEKQGRLSNNVGIRSRRSKYAATRRYPSKRFHSRHQA